MSFNLPLTVSAQGPLVLVHAAAVRLGHIQLQKVITLKSTQCKELFKNEMDFKELVGDGGWGGLLSIIHSRQCLVCAFILVRSESSICAYLQAPYHLLPVSSIRL
jgi:hypothetical protein